MLPNFVRAVTLEDDAPIGLVRLPWNTSNRSPLVYGRTKQVGDYGHLYRNVVVSKQAYAVGDLVTSSKFKDLSFILTAMWSMFHPINKRWFHRVRLW